MARPGEIHAAARSPDLEVGLDRNDHEIVLRLAEDGTFGFGDADHLERQAIHRDGAADRVGAGEELVLDVVPDEGHVHAAVVLDVGEEAALCGLVVDDHRHIGRHTLQADVFRRSPCRRARWRCGPSPCRARWLSVACARRNSNSSRLQLAGCAAASRGISCSPWSATMRVTR